MLLFKERINYYDPLNVIFLCGSKFTPKSDKDKRIILKDFLLSSDHDCQIVILEENFSFVKNQKGYLAYDDIFITNLSEVEKLAALYANKVIVIHETISTGAEIGMFASNPLLTSKVCVLFPDDISIEEKKMSSFIELAFFNNYDLINPKPTKLEYYPDNVMGIDASLFSINVKLIGIEKCKFRQAIGYFLYMLQAINLIALEQLSDANNKKRKIRIKETMDPYICEFKNYIYEKPETVFGGIMS